MGVGLVIFKERVKCVPIEFAQFIPIYQYSVF
jgi:hypothetical protein